MASARYTPWDIAIKSIAIAGVLIASRKKRCYLSIAHVIRMWHATLRGAPADTEANPVDIGFFRLEAIVQMPNPLAHLIEQAGRLQRGRAGFHEEFMPVFFTMHGAQSQQASGLQRFFLKDVSSRPGCIHRALPSTLCLIDGCNSGVSANARYLYRDYISGSVYSCDTAHGQE